MPRPVRRCSRTAVRSAGGGASPWTIAFTGRYSGEVQLIRQDLPADEKVNVIGYIQPGYELLMDCIRRGSRFCMVKEDTCEL